jgi:hypothetical protein
MVQKIKFCFTYISAEILLYFFCPKHQLILRDKVFVTSTLALNLEMRLEPTQLEPLTGLYSKGLLALLTIIRLRWL